jgi:hypothetical protein
MKKNEIEILPITTWVNGQIKTLTVLKLDNYFQYDFLMSPGMVHYAICEPKEITLEDGETEILYVSVIDGNIDLPWTLVDNWGTDDTPIFDYVIQQLQLTKKP